MTNKADCVTSTFKSRIAELENENLRLQMLQNDQLRILESVEIFNRTLGAIKEPDEILAQGLDQFLEFFTCDRAWLLYPCDPNINTFRVLMEKFRPQWPGAQTVGIDLPQDEASRKIMELAINSPGPVRFDPEQNTLNLDDPINSEFHIRSQLAMVIRPKVGKPWLLGIHHCEKAVIYSQNDCDLFGALGSHFADSISNMLAWQEAENLFENAEISILNEDFLEIRIELDRLHSSGLKDIRKYLEEDEQKVLDFVGMLKLHQVNGATLKLFGAKTSEDFIVQIDKTFGKKTIDTFVDELCAIWEGMPAFRSETTFHTLDGRDIDAIISFKIPENKDDFHSIPVSIVDITERKHAERKLLSAKNEAESANKAKSEFLASMSHELRTPLNAVLGFAQMLQFDPKPPLSLIQNDYVESILEGGNHLLKLVNEILDLASIEAHHFDLSLDDFEANDIVSTCLNLVAPLGLKYNVKIINEFSNGPLVALFSDRTRLKQVLINLLANAIKFNKDGGTVTVEGKETDYGYLRISVIDTGIGINKEDQSSVFNLFHQVDADSKTTREGTGIGLTVTKLLVERMAGRVGFESEEGAGSTFWIELPLATNDDVLIWTNSIKVGVDAQDKDHQILISMLNRLSRRSAGDEDVDGIINELIDFAQYHFSREEAIMEACDYLELEKHRDLHRALIYDLNQHCEIWRKDRNQKNLNLLQKFLKGWLLDHIMKEDAKIVYSTKGKNQDIREKLITLGLMSPT